SGAGAGGGGVSGSSGQAGASGGPGKEGPPCGEGGACEAGLLCAGGVCERVLGPCQGDSDCDGDSYCCAEGCAEGGQSGCIAYGTGPQGNLNDSCTVQPVPGLFEATVQCEWVAPPAGDPYPSHVQVLVTPLVADLPIDGGNAAAEIVVVTYNGLDGGSPSSVGTDPNAFGVIRVLNGQTCAQLASIADPANPIIGSTTPTIGDLDGDGIPEIVSHRATGGLVAFRWDGGQGKYVTYWVSTETNLVLTNHYDGPSMHDLDDDGFPEILSASEVYDGRTGKRLNPGQNLFASTLAGNIAVAGDVDGDGQIELLAGPVYRWNKAQKLWEQAYPGAPALPHYAFADFGTPGATPGDFDPTTFDGIAEIVGAGTGRIVLATLQGQILVDLPGGVVGGGPPTIGDFDNDGRPEFATAGGTSFKVIDLDCAAPGTPGCAEPFVRWVQPSQDASSATTGSSIFDFEGDGQAEAVYADECFARVYDGKTGDVLYSAYRTSCTWYENAVVADPDRDSNTEILVGSNANCNVQCPQIDPIHKGIRCADAAECKSGTCSANLCRCTGDDECPQGYRCIDPLDNPGEGKTCRAYHPPSGGQVGVRVLRDRLDRWVSSRPLWNQHAYSITNVNDDATIPQTSAWTQNHTTPGLNNFRQQTQGSAAANAAPDITGKLDKNTVCKVTGQTVTLSATVCNRGKKAVGAALPATFYKGNPADGVLLCTSYTAGPVPSGGCLEVSCEVPVGVDGEITMVVNDDGAGNKTTVECESGNNEDRVQLLAECKP
ncbi:MAG: VCBS repeat-containing protein, partial [Polyangiaceae bacterium]|nr:VCBS repeat-containing protein [Polyangiaceae bacterium]